MPTIFIVSNYAVWLYIVLGLRVGVNLKSRNFWILCCDNIPFANIRALHVLHLSIMRPVLVGFNVAILLQNKQCIYRSHGLITDNLLMYSISYPSYIYSAKRISRDSSASPDLWWRIRSPGFIVIRFKAMLKDRIPSFLQAMYWSLDLEYRYKQCIDGIKELRLCMF